MNGGRNNTAAQNSTNAASFESYVQAYDDALAQGASSAKAAAIATDVLSQAAKGGLAGIKGGPAGVALGSAVGVAKGAYDAIGKDYSDAAAKGRDSARDDMNEALNAGNWGQSTAETSNTNGGAGGPGGGLDSSGDYEPPTPAQIAGEIGVLPGSGTTGGTPTKPSTPSIVGLGTLVPLAEQLWWGRNNRQGG